MSKPKKTRSKEDRQWAEAKRLCRLNRRDIQMAKELGFKPRSLTKNIPSPTQQWKLPVKLWIRRLYEEKMEKNRAKKNHGTQNIKLAEYAVDHLVPLDSYENELELIEDTDNLSADTMLALWDEYVDALKDNNGSLLSTRSSIQQEIEEEN